MHVCNELLAKCAAEQAAPSTAPSKADAAIVGTAASDSTNSVEVVAPTVDDMNGTIETGNPAVLKPTDDLSPPASADSESDRPKGSALLRVFGVLRRLRPLPRL